MWNFWFLIILGLYWLWKTGSEEKIGRMVDTDSELRAIAMEKLYKEFGMSSDEEHAIDLSIQRRDDEVLSLARGLKKLTGLTTTESMLKFAMCAMRGKLPSRLELDGYESPLGGTHDIVSWRAPILDGTDLYEPVPTLEECREARRKFLVWYDGMLQTHGFPYDLLYAPFSGTDGPSSTGKFCYIEEGIKISDVKKLGDGQCFWARIGLSFKNVRMLDRATRFQIYDLDERTRANAAAARKEREEKRRF